ncbi:MAG: D-alanyl-lipoteichoic acid biosynthesis protein DltD [Oscillatoria sp. PMC 1068.18]|nr:D-alanyl-lipoteichoic acid biosynthesis protein DltD [Oscillatoria sp. PMC 1076.18]MEC4990928.1 D-alanyl-lipoteichoic acid biosynthesis protein DltD [Oscillatoria sp. PMC 1068.18]
MPQYRFFTQNRSRKFGVAIATVILALIAGLTQILVSAQKPEAKSSSSPSADASESMGQCSLGDSFEQAQQKASLAENLAGSAQTAQDWNLVIIKWIQAIEGMQGVALSSPKRADAEKQAQEYQQNLAIAQLQATPLRQQLPFESFNSQFFNEQLLLYLSYTAAMGAPDILIVGSSRAVQGVDPHQLRYDLATQGKEGLKIFNFGINGATTQVVDLILREIVSPNQQPKLIIWADGLRSFNSGRKDITYNGLAASRGYQVLSAGISPQLGINPILINSSCQLIPFSSISRDSLLSRNLAESLLPSPKILSPAQFDSLSGRKSAFQDFLPAPGKRALAAEIIGTDANGFLAIATRFNPGTYYQQNARIAGNYDADYLDFNLNGKQTVALNRIIAHSKKLNIPVVFVNIPLSNEYLDEIRLAYEQEFSQWMQQQANTQGFIFIDLLTKWGNENSYFQDPSHLNRYGAIAVSRELANHPEIKSAVTRD